MLVWTLKRDCGLLSGEWDRRAPCHVTATAIKGSGRPRSRCSCSQTRVQEKSGPQEYLLHVSLTREPGFRLKETLFKHYPQLSVLALFFISPSFPPPPFLPLIFSSLKYVGGGVEGGLEPNRHEVLIAVTRGSQMLEIMDGFARSFPSSIPFLSPSPCLSLWTSWVWRTLPFKCTKNSVAEVHLSCRQTHRSRLRLRLELRNFQEIFGTCFSLYSSFSIIFNQERALRKTSC